MALAHKHYDIIDVETGKLDRSIFVDEAVYQEELEKIFGRAWLMIGHDSLVPNTNDFFHTYMGEDPVILTRDNSGKLHALLNMCRHRGNRIIRADDGNAKNFMCTYHGWSFSNDGSLEHVPGEERVYYNELDKANLSLVEAKVDTYAGIVFATWDHEAPSLEEYLGDARWYLDTVFNRKDSGMVAVGPIKWLQPVNWKTPVDNSSDNYHVPITHASAARVKAKFLGRELTTMEQQFESTARHMSVNGHSITIRAPESTGLEILAGVDQENKELFRAYMEESLPEVERRLGSYRTHSVKLGNHSIFPNGVLGFRLSHPRGPLKTEFWDFALFEKDAPEAMQRALTSGHASNNGAAGLNEQDDIDNWRSVTESAKSPVARRFAQDISMGMGRAGAHDDLPGTVANKYISESNQRHFYLRWQEFMNAESWADIHIDPMTAVFEGTATMNS